MKKAAIVILNWNGADLLRRFLPSVLANSGSDAAVYVADNASTDDSLQAVEAEMPQAKVIRLDRNYGFAEGYNRALAGLQEDYFVLLNSDVEVAPGWLDTLLAYMERHAEVAACQPKILSYRRRDSFEYAGAAGGYIDSLGYPFCRGRVLSTVERDRGQYDTVRPVFWATGAALMIRRVDWIAAGGLDARFFAHMEEIDLCWRLRSRGRLIVCVPQSVVYHVGGATLSKSNPRKTYLNFRNNLLLIYKNAPSYALRHTMRVRFWLDMLAALVFLLTGHAADARAVVRARRDYRRMRRDFSSDRSENLAKTVVSSIPEQMSGSVLFRYYVRGRRTFSVLDMN